MKKRDLTALLRGDPDPLNPDPRPQLIHPQEDRPAVREKATSVVVKLKKMKLSGTAEMVEAGIEETKSYMDFLREHWRSLRTNHPLERVMRETRRRTRMGAWPDGKSALMLVCARFRHMAGATERPVATWI